MGLIERDFLFSNARLRDSDPKMTTSMLSLVVYPFSSFSFPETLAHATIPK